MIFTAPTRVITNILMHGSSVPAHTKKEKHLVAYKEGQRQRPQSLYWIRLMERYIELGGKQMTRPALINLICDNVDDLVEFSACGCQSVVLLCDSNVVILTMIKAANYDGNLGEAVDVVATYMKT